MIDPAIIQRLSTAITKTECRTKTVRACQLGILRKPASCERCNAATGTLDRHHPHYSKPLEIRWLCKPCHKIEDREVRKSSAPELTPLIERISMLVRSGRAAKKLSQTELGRLIGLSRSSVGSIEDGCMISLDVAISLRDVLGISLNDLADSYRSKQ